MPFVVPGTAQYTINGTYAGRAVANVFHMKIDTTGSIAQRADAVRAMAGIFLNQWTTDIMALIGSAYTANSVAWVDLDSATGSVGAISTSGANVWPKAGSGASATLPGSVALLIRKNVSGQRGARKGRVYLVGIDESLTVSPANNTITTAGAAAWQAKWTAFYGNINQTDQGPLTYNARQCVAHVLTRAEPKPGQDVGVPLTGTPVEVTSMTVDNTLATQRRRLRG